jgi:hypothetical protein
MLVRPSCDVVEHHAPSHLSTAPGTFLVRTGCPSSMTVDNHTRNVKLRKARRAAKHAEEDLAAGRPGPALKKMRRALQAFVEGGVDHSKIRAKIEVLETESKSLQHHGQHTKIDLESTRAKARGREILGRLAWAPTVDSHPKVHGLRLNIVQDVAVDDHSTRRPDSSSASLPPIPRAGASSIGESSSGKLSGRRPPYPRGHSAPLDASGEFSHLSGRAASVWGTALPSDGDSSTFKTPTAGSTNTRGDRPIGKPTYVTPRGSSTDVWRQSALDRQYTSMPPRAVAEPSDVFAQVSQQCGAVSDRRSDSGIMDPTGDSVSVKFDWSAALTGEAPTIRRIRVHVCPGFASDPPFQAAVASQAESYGVDTNSITLAYVDEENDECRITASVEWEAALKFALRDCKASPHRGILHIRVSKHMDDGRLAEGPSPNPLGAYVVLCCAMAVFVGCCCLLCKEGLLRKS